MNLSPRVVQGVMHALIVGCILFAATSAFSAEAVISSLKGTLSVQKADGNIKILAKGSEVQVGDVLTTEKDSIARLKFTDGSEVAMRPQSRIRIDKYGFTEDSPQEDSMVFSLVKGGLRTLTGLVGKRGNRDAYRLQTATATIGIRGTDYGALNCEQDCEKLADGVYVNVNNGRIAAANNAGELEVGAGQFAYIASLDTLPILLNEDPGLPPFPDAFDFTDSQTDGAGCYIR